MKNTRLILLAFILIVVTGFKGLPAQGQPVPSRTVRAVKTENAIKVDGELNESVWQLPGYSDFVQSEPNDGSKATEKTLVWVAYDEDAIYIAARLMDSCPESISCDLGRRDYWVESDWFVFAVDPYFDRRTGFQFAVNPSGSIVDWTLYNDEWRDSSWDGIWKSATKIDKTGWCVEIRIPYSQLRFKPKREYTWGVNFQRYIKRKKEKASFAWVSRKDSGYVSRFARLVGIKNIKSGKKIEVTPYSVGRAGFSPQEEGNPFATGKDFLGNAGMDIKVRLKSDLTLNATFNPDFGQVEVDPAVLNLGANEVYFQEKRPFFVEGRNIYNFGYGGSTSHWSFNWGSPSFFYSRRIGRTPRGSVDTGGYSSSPDGTTILGAAKVTGKLGGNWNLGFLSAVTQREYADISENGNLSRAEVEPAAYYGVLRAQREFNSGMQGLGFMSTAVLRDFSGRSVDSQFCSKAYGFGLDGWTFLDKKKVWVISSWLGGTLVQGNSAYIKDLQESYLHYFQRPDASHLRYDSSATRLSGWAGRILLNKQKGNWFVNAALGAISPGFDSTELGFQWAADVVNSHVGVGYRSFDPGKVLRSWNLIGATFRSFDFAGNKISAGYFAEFYGRFLNFWSASLRAMISESTLDNRITRGGPLMRSPGGYSLSSQVESDPRKNMTVRVHGGYRRGSEGSWGMDTQCRLRWKVKSNLFVSITPEYSRNHRLPQWVSSFADPLMSATFGNRYVFATLDQHSIAAELRLNWAFTPRISLQLFLQPYISTGRYRSFRELAAPGSFAFNCFSEAGGQVAYDGENYTIDPDGSGPTEAFSFENPDFNFKSLRGTVVFRYEYRPGSTLYLVWTQRRSDYANPGEFRLFRDLNDMLSSRGDNIFMLKFTYRFEV